jgi:hexosaminidase
MKKFLRILLYIVLSILSLIVVFVLFLFVSYSVFERQEKREARILHERAMVTKTYESTVTPPHKEVLNLIPLPGKVNFTGGTYTLTGKISYSIIDSLKNIAADYLRNIPGIIPSYSSAGTNILFRYNRSVPVQGYHLDIKPDQIVIDYSTPQGLYYAIVSLKVLKQNYKGAVPCAYIEDAPDLQVRGLMLDISRNKIPTRETLLQIAGLLSDLKYNHLELYIEGFSFAYPSFKSFWEGKETPVTGDDIKALDAFCRAHYIDLVPNQNSLGHMTSWLATNEYRDLAECPKGYKILGLINSIGTLDPKNPRSIELLRRMTDDLLPNFSSPNFNVNLDEPFELGKGKNKELAKKDGIGPLYLEYALKMHDIAKANNKNMLMWGDIVLKHAELIPRIPKDITLLDWGYESSYPYERHCKALQASGLHYMVCPGTNSWTSITGRTDNMLATIKNATTNGYKYGATGMILTDWGDMGHWQYLPVSYPGYVAGAALSWNCESRKEANLGRFLNSYVFMDENGTMGDLALDLGRYCRFEEIPMFNMTTTMLAFQFGMRDKIMISAIYDKFMKGFRDLMEELAPEMITIFNEKYDNRQPFDYPGIQEFIDSKEQLLKTVKIKSPDSAIVLDEYKNAIRLIRLGVELQKYTDFRSSMNAAEERSSLTAMKQLGKRYLDENKKLWMLRNRSGGYETSVGPLNLLMQQVDKRLLLLDKSGFTRSVDRFIEKIGTAGAVYYLKFS